MARREFNSIRLGGTVATFKRIETKTGTPMVRFTVQCQKDYIVVVAFKELADSTDLNTGDFVEVEGSVQNTLWKDGQGNTRSGFQVIARDIWREENLLDEDFDHDEDLFMEADYAAPALPGLLSARKRGTARKRGIARRAGQQALPMQSKERQGVMAAGKDEGLPF